MLEQLPDGLDSWMSTSVNVVDGAQTHKVYVDAFDENGDGVVDYAELKAGLAAIGSAQRPAPPPAVEWVDQLRGQPVLPESTNTVRPESAAVPREWTGHEGGLEVPATPAAPAAPVVAPEPASEALEEDLAAIKERMAKALDSMAAAVETVAQRDLFHQIDENSNGAIEAEEVRRLAAVAHVYLSESELDAVKGEMGLDKQVRCVWRYRHHI
jgi:Ca2+-binding EF-hand superfamily protein